MRRPSSTHSWGELYGRGCTHAQWAPCSSSSTQHAHAASAHRKPWTRPQRLCPRRPLCSHVHSHQSTQGVPGWRVWCHVHLGLQRTGVCVCWLRVALVVQCNRVVGVWCVCVCGPAQPSGGGVVLTTQVHMLLLPLHLRRASWTDTTSASPGSTSRVRVGACNCCCLNERANTLHSTAPVSSHTNNAAASCACPRTWGRNAWQLTPHTGALCLFAYLYLRPFVRRGLGSARRWVVRVGG